MNSQQFYINNNSSRFLPHLDLVDTLLPDPLEILQNKLKHMLGLLVDDFDHHGVENRLHMFADVLHVLYCLVLLLLLARLLLLLFGGLLVVRMGLLVVIAVAAVGSV